MNRSLLRAFCLLGTLVVAHVLVFGQVETGTIAGVVKDATGAVVADAQVVVRNVATNAERTAVTSNLGQYSVPALPPGNYRVSVSKSGFKTYETAIEVTVGGHSTVDVELAVGSGNTVVEVTAAGAATEVNTQTQELQQLIDTQQLGQLPSLTRNAYDFVALSGNVSGGDTTSVSQGNNSVAGSGQNLTTRGVSFNLNGQRQTGTEILLDGVENVSVFTYAVGENVPIDSVQEYSVITNNFSADYGRASGGVVNVTTKEGTNQFHGSAWEFNRLAAYTANTFANDAEGFPKGQYTRNQFGYLLGGPIIKNKLFFSQSTEWTRIRSQASLTQEIIDPSFLAMLPANTQSYFTQFGTGAYPVAGAASTAGQLGLAGSQINGTGAPLSASQAVFDTVNYKANFDAGGGFPGNQYTLVGRLDYNLNDKTQMFLRVGRENIDYLPGTVFYSPYPQYDIGFTDLNQSYLYSLTHAFNDSLVNNSKISFTRFNNQNSFNAALINTPSLELGTTTDPATGVYIQMPGLQNQGPGSGGLPFGGPQNTLQVQDDLSWIKGKHSVRFGGAFTYMQLNVAYGAYVQAEELLGPSFATSLTDLINSAGNPGGTQLTTFAARVNPQGALPCPVDQFGNLITSQSCAVTPPLATAADARSYRFKDWAVYAQDSFRVTSRLTLNYGLRYEHYGVQHNNIQSLDSNFYYGSGSGIEQQVQNGQVQLTQKSSIGQFWAPRWGTAAPRVGFAYDLFGTGKSSLRAGFGVSYERNFGNVTYNASFNPPGSAVVSANCGPGDATCATLVTNSDLGPLGLPGPPSYLPPVELRMPDPKINVAQTQFWSLALQQQVARNSIVELSYSGAHGIHLYDLNNINQLGAGQAYLGEPLITGAACSNNGAVSYNTPASPTPECLTRANPQYAAINMRGSRGGSSYSALNLRFQTQNIHSTGLSLVANYTWAHALDDVSSTFDDSLQGLSSPAGFGNLGYTDYFNPKLDWGSADFDIRNRLVVSPIWDTPWFKSGRSAASQALGGWSVVGVFTARTGTPFSVFDEDNIEVGYTNPRLTPATGITSYKVGSPQRVGPNVFNVMSLPLPASFAPLNPTLGISDLGPWPANMTHRNAFRGPGAWNSDLAVSKTFRITEGVGLEFRAEGFNVFNHHNYYVNPTDLLYSGPSATGAYPSTPLNVTEEKGGLGALATGANHDERRFGQFALRLTF